MELCHTQCISAFRGDNASRPPTLVLSESPTPSMRARIGSRESMDPAVPSYLASTTALRKGRRQLLETEAIQPSKAHLVTHISAGRIGSDQCAGRITRLLVIICLTRAPGSMNRLSLSLTIDQSVSHLANQMVARQMPCVPGEDACLCQLQRSRHGRSASV